MFTTKRGGTGEMGCFFIARPRRPFLQLNRVSMRLGKHAEFGQRREQREKELGSK